MLLLFQGKWTDLRGQPQGERLDKCRDLAGADAVKMSIFFSVESEDCGL